MVAVAEDLTNHPNHQFQGRRAIRVFRAAAVAEDFR